MKIQLKKKNLKSLTNKNVFSKNMTPKVAGGIGDGWSFVDRCFTAPFDKKNGPCMER